MSRAFTANYAGTPPAPFAPFEAGESVFYLVGIEAGAGLPPAPGAELTITRRNEDQSGNYKKVTETARNAERRVMATRSFRWHQWTRGAKGRAARLAVWTTPQGAPLAIWCNIVSVSEAASLGYATPGGFTIAQRGRRGVGHENTVQATIRGGRAVPAPGASAVDAAGIPAAPVQNAAESLLSPSPALGGNLASLQAEANANAQAAQAAQAAPTPAWVAGYMRDPQNVALRAEAVAARAEQAAALEAAQAAEAAALEAAALALKAEAAALDLDAGQQRFAGLDLGSAPSAPWGSDEDEEPGRCFLDLG